jgi:hypothetical protein
LEMAGQTVRNPVSRVQYDMAIDAIGQDVFDLFFDDAVNDAINSCSIS